LREIHEKLNLDSIQAEEGSGLLVASLAANSNLFSQVGSPRPVEVGSMAASSLPSSKVGTPGASAQVSQRKASVQLERGISIYGNPNKGGRSLYMGLDLGRGGAHTSTVDEDEEEDA
jgi:hypothetical protein